MSQHIKRWQEHMPEPREAFCCTMNCSPRNQPCGDCVPYMAYGDPLVARDVEIAELRAALAAMAKDAERYRHLRDTGKLETAIWEALDGYGAAEEEDYAEGLDAAIDAALAARKEPSNG